jgi:hypothetical protein
VLPAYLASASGDRETGLRPVLHERAGGWGALVARAQQGDPPGQPGPRPNARPWEHLGDLEALSEQLRLRLG